MCLCTISHFLAGILSNVPGPINLHSKTCHMHCPSHSSSCYSVQFSVSVSLKTVTSLPVVLGAGNLLAILLLVIERCVPGERYSQILATCTHLIATIWINKFQIIKELQSFPTFNFSVCSCSLRSIANYSLGISWILFFHFYTTQITCRHSSYNPPVCHVLPYFSSINGDWITLL